MFRMKPTRMTISDHRPSLSYRVGVDVVVRNTLHWVELALASNHHLFATDAEPQRTRGTFVTFQKRFALPGNDAVLHIPPSALLALVGSERIYAGWVLFDVRTGGIPLAVIRPDAMSVYVTAGSFSGTGVTQRFGFAARPSMSGDSLPDDSAGALRWSGDRPEPGRVSAAAMTRRTTSFPQSGRAPDGVVSYQKDILR